MRYFASAGGLEREYRFERRGGRLLVHVDGAVHELDVVGTGDGSAFSMLVDGRSVDVLIERGERGPIVHVLGRRVDVQVEDERERTAHAVAGQKPAGPRTVCAVMPGIVVEVAVAVGDVVADGQTLLVLEAMKMRNPIAADGAGRVKRVHAKAGQAVAGGAVLIELEAAS